MIISTKSCEGLKTTVIIGERLRLLIKKAIKDNRYANQQDFFDHVQARLKNNKADISNPNTYKKYLNGSSNMQLDVFKQICIELNCSANFLMGITPINSDYVGSIIRLLTDIDDCISYEWDQIDTNILHINYYGTNLSYRDNELADKVKDLINATLFIDSKRK